MNWIRRAVLAAAIVAVGAPAAAQNTGFSGVEFVAAVRSGDNGKAVELLRATPTVLNARDSRGETALYAAVANRDSTWTSYLLGQGADPNLPTRSGDTPLIAAARIGFVDAAEWLIADGAKVNAGNRMGETPLIVAVQGRQIPMIRLLLEQGADPDKSDSAAGLSARDYAIRDTRARDILKLIEAKKPKPAL